MRELLKTVFSKDHLDAMIQAVASIISVLIPLLLAGIVILIRFARTSLPATIFQKQLKKRAERVQQKHIHKIEQQLDQYIHNVLSSPRIAQIHILGMNHPLQLEEIYVPVQVHPGNTLRYTLDTSLYKAEEEHDPNVLLQAVRASLEGRLDGALEPDEAIRQYKHCVIIGDPGSGKTTLLHYLTMKAAKKELPGLPSLPVYIELNTFNINRDNDLLEFIKAQFHEYNYALNIADIQDELHKKMCNGQVLLLLDGLDETRISMSEDPTLNAYTAMVAAIEKLSSIYPSMPIIVSSRKAGYQHQPKLRGFDELEMLDFQLEDSQAFVSHWFTASQVSHKAEKIRDLTIHLTRNLRIQSVASNPLLLSLAAIVYVSNLELPERRADFYKQCVEVLQSRWDASRDIKRPRQLHMTLQSQLLQEIAWYYHTQGRYYLPRDELLQIIGKFLLSIDKAEDASSIVLEQIVRESGLLREQAQGWYGFSHLTFQEYFVTQYIIANNRQEDLMQQLHNPWWEEVLLLYTGSINDAGPLFRTLLDRDTEKQRQNDFYHTDLLLAGHCLGEKPRVRKVALREEVIDKLFQVLLTTPYAFMREQTANTLAQIGGPRTNSRLLQLLSSHDPHLLDIRHRIGWALGMQGERPLARDLMHILMQPETGRYIRIIIVRALSTLRNQAIVPMLHEILSDEAEDIYLRQSIALALGTLADPQSITVLLQRLENRNENPLVQQSVAVALGMLSASSSLQALLPLLIDESLDWHVRGSIAKTLAILGKQKVLPQLLLVLENNSDNTYVRRCTATAFGLLDQAYLPVERLLTLLTTTSIDPSIRGNIAHVLGKIGGTKVTDILLDLLVNTQTPLQVSIPISVALSSLDKKNEQVLRRLKQLSLESAREKNLRGCISATLGILGDRSVVHELLDLLADVEMSQDCIVHITDALCSLGDHESVDKQEIAIHLVKLLASNTIDRYRGQHCVKLLQSLQVYSVLPCLIQLLSDTAIERYVRQNIADALIQFPCTEQDMILLTALLGTLDISDDIFRALWIMQHRQGLFL